MSSSRRRVIYSASGTNPCRLGSPSVLDRALLGTVVAVLALLLAGCLGTDGASERGLGPPDSGLPSLESLSVVDGWLSSPPLIDDGQARRVGEVAEAAHRLGREREALDLLVSGYLRHGLYADGLAHLAALLEREGEIDLAMAAQRSALRAGPTPERAGHLAAIASRWKSRDEALSAWLEAHRAYPRDRQIRGRLAVAQYFARAEVDELLLDDAPTALRALMANGAMPRARIRTLDADSSDRLGTSFGLLGAEVRIDSGGSSEAGEVSMVAWGDQLTVAWNDLRQGGGNGIWRLGVGTSSDGGATWVDQIVRHPAMEPGVYEGDPMTAIDHRTGDRWVGAIRFFADGGVYVAHQRPDGVIEPPVIVMNGSPDKCWMAAGALPGNPNATRVYVVYNFPNSLQRSTDLGTTWSQPVAIDPDGISFLPRVAPDGTLYLGYSEFGNVAGPGVMLQTSLDGGVTVGAPRRVVDRMDSWDLQNGSRFPGQFRVPGIPNMAVAPDDGALYFAYMDTTAVNGGDSDVDIYLVRSSDAGQTWSTPTIVAGGPSVAGDQFMPWIEIDDAGRLHMAFFDSRHTPQADDVVDARIDIYYSTSGDDGASWSEIRVTDTSFSTAAINWPGQGQFLGDYLGLAVDDGRVWVSYPKPGAGGDLDIYVRQLTVGQLFEDGFESGSAQAWTQIVP